ncbi:hypothetical protein GLOTRDRAFT_139764 [Gloeophyllum trabeum ATCC 11539]|uniref:RING-type domain-containing protein n=1 Tax=Gloeophyllum trabeum (strain ATCC 11539 / FP-39264 / Madison 617) TaxID=670483 RepID=S7Q201_GLOTA|nr:uncharacterized protein GLOTRDRAFT_139764 [Gloeophyllum trabeum ATCC 11539]EPQ53578.1 hypothetical protein GLOTRDRAFT_139764 [Gloeophyllum trabeum ATCC 11539]
MPATTTKHAFSFPMVPASAPTTPAPVSRSTRSDRQAFSPITPQRLNRGHRHQLTSPITPASTMSTPYTPLSLRSFTSSDASMLDTPISVLGGKRLNSSMSPEVHTHSKNKHSVADITDNWRSRAKENGIRVTPSQESRYADDEASDPEYSENAPPAQFVNDQALLPPAFLSTHRRARALSQSNIAVQPASPQIPSTPDRRTLADLNTPPPKAVNITRLKMKGSMTDPAIPRRRPAFGQVQSNVELFDIGEDEYAPYPQTFSPAQPFSHSHSVSFSDPFHVRSLSPINEGAFHFNDFQEAEAPWPIESTSCSVCGREASSLAILDPCGHPLCSGCLTSALNIVGEKDMQCAVCKTSVDDFHLKNVPVTGSGSAPTSRPSPKVMDDSPLNGFDDAELFFDRLQGASTPIEDVPRAGDYPVLRIDNVPWDITPPAITAWLKHPVVRVHVLLDRKGKTLSHAYAEMVNEDAMKKALRTAQNAVLGKGKRARGVTVTRSNQEELMKALFPSWQGAFDGSRPSLAGLTNDVVISTLGCGLMSESELNALLHLIRSPDSHFLKVPSLPFHSLISILSKFPADVDSRVFWSSSLRDTLYDVTSAAIQVLVSRVNENQDQQYVELLQQLGEIALDCQAFTSQQIRGLADMLEAVSGLQFSSLSPNNSFGSATSSEQLALQGPPGLPAPARRASPSGDAFDALAREFGVDAHVVEALAQRLTGMC